jgi:hypothetical protein
MSAREPVDTTESAVSAVARLDANVELRPSLLRSYSQETLDCYQRRMRHYADWCHVVGYQPDARWITADKALEYVQAQIKAQELTPSTLRQAVNALVYQAERAQGEAPDVRAAKELVRRYEDAWKADGNEPAYRVPGRKSPRPRRT